MVKFLTIFIPLVIMLLCTYLKYGRSKKQISNLTERKKYKFLNSSELQETIIQVAIVFLGAFLAMSITEHMEKKAAYNSAESMMDALYFSQTNKFSQIYYEIHNLDAKEDVEKNLDGLVKSVQASSSLMERESLLNDYVLSTLTPGTIMSLSTSYENLDHCTKKLEIVESTEEKVTQIVEYCYHNCVLSFEYEVLRQDPSYEILILALDDATGAVWENSTQSEMYTICIDKLEEVFGVDLTEWRERKPYSQKSINS